MEGPMRRLKIGISGSYGGMNLGDEAILEGILIQLRATLHAEITVFSRHRLDTLARHQVERVIGVRELTRKEATQEVQGLDLLILGGGGILYDREAETYLREIFIAHELGVPVFVYAISAGPLITRASRWAVQTALNAAAVITVRDRQGNHLLEEVGVTREIHLTADPAFLIQPEALSVEELKGEGVEFDRRLIGFSVREPGPAAPDIDPEEYHALLANAADFAIEKLNADVLFVPMEKVDLQHSHAVIARMRCAERAGTMRHRYSPRQILDLIGRFEFAVGMRLHFLIFAARRGTPFVALPYASKVTGLLEDLDMETPLLGNVGAGQLIARIDRCWDMRSEIRAKIMRKLPDLERRARKTNELLLQFLQKRAAA
jgi:polysaccharide pyruvyl transferase CsaB